MPTEYDEHPYDAHAHTETHPDHVGAIATLFGIQVTPPERARVLELGCGLGQNLIAMAVALPDAEFVGVDLSTRQIDAGKAEVAALGLSNVALHAMNILDVGPDLGRFDYILCHGVYSWVPAPVKRHILASCRALLAPLGVAYVSINTLPGWYLRGMVRSMLLREVGRGRSAEERIAQARAFLKFLGHAPPNGSRAQAALASELELLGKVSDAYVLHEHLAEHNTPEYFGDFARDAARAGLSYVADAQIELMNPERFTPEAQEIMHGTARDVIDTEQFLDYLDVRFFRRSIFCHEEVPVDRRLDESRLYGLRISSRFMPKSPREETESEDSQTFVTSTGGELATGHPIVKAALHALAAERPGGLPFSKLAEVLEARTAEARAVLGGHLLRLAVRGGVRLGGARVPCVASPSEHPVTTALVRREAEKHQQAATNLLHERVAIDRLDWVLLPLMDGTRDVEALTTGVIAGIERGDVVLEVEGERRADRGLVDGVVRERLAAHGRLGLLVG